MSQPLAAVATQNALLHHAFWSSTLAQALVIAVCAILIGVAVAFVLTRHSHRSSVRERVGEFLAAGSTPDGPESGRPAGRALARAERSLEGERRWDEFKRKLEIARIKRPAIEIVYLTAACSLAAAVLLTVLTGTPLVGILALAFGPLAARAIVDHRLQRQRNLFAEQLPAHLQELAATMRAGHSMSSGLVLIADGASEPIRGEFQRAIADERLGMELEDTLRLVAERMDARDMEQVSLVAELHRRTGGNMAEVLDRVAEAVRAHAELNRELRALTAQARGSRWIVTMIPPILVVIIELLNPGYLEPLFATDTGRLFLFMAIALVIGGSLVMRRIARIEV